MLSHVYARLKDRIAASDWFEVTLRVVVLAVSFVLERFGPGSSDGHGSKS